MKVQWVPRNDNVLVQLDAKQEKTAGGIFLASKDQKEENVATVLAVGVGRLTINGERVPINLKKGDRVLLFEFAGQLVGPEADRIYLVREDSILCQES